MNGVLIVNKPVNMTSHDVIFKLRKILKTKKIGHCGTLDPLASGVLVCLVGKATKLSNFLVMDTKEYYATFKLGIATTTQDLEGEVVAEKKYQFNLDETIIKQTLEKFLGEQMQTPSIYSAIKVNGKKLYEYARNNEEVEIPKRLIDVFQIELISFVDDLISIRVLCSSGTYIRSLCFDIAAALGYPGVLTKLVRSQSGNISLAESYNLEEIENNEFELLSIEDALLNYPFYVVESETELVDIKNGKQIKGEFEEEFVVKYQDEIIAIYHPSNLGQAKMKRGLW